MVAIFMIVIVLVTMLAFVLVFLGMHHHHDLSVSKCVGNQTGMQFTEGNVTGNPSSACL